MIATSSDGLIRERLLAQAGGRFLLKFAAEIRSVDPLARAIPSPEGNTAQIGYILS